MRENTTKAKMLRGEAVIGPFIPMPSAMAMELTALAGMDFGIIDCEHGYIDYESVYPMALAAEARGMTAIARCPVRDPQLILRYLDLGVQGLHVPQINTKEEAEAFVQACRYQPRGWRGSASPRAVDNLEEICAVEGLDVLCVGRGDMSHALGVPNQFDHPSVQEQMRRVVEKSKGSGKILGTVVRDAAQAREAIDMGFLYIACGFASFIVGGMKQFLAETRK